MSALNRRSRALVAGPSRAPARAMLKGIGFTDADLERPLIGIANTWIETMPCNFHLRDLAVHVKEGVRAAGGTPMEFNTISISDGVTMGTQGMKASLVSREVIADSIELCTRGYLFDALVVLVGCDKTMPGAAMALARLDIPGVILYGGSIDAGHLDGKDLTVQDVFEAVGAHQQGKIGAAELKAIEALGMSLPDSSAQDAISENKRTDCRRAGAAVLKLLEQDIRPSHILTRKAFENAITVTIALGGSTNLCCTPKKYCGGSPSREPI